MAADTTAGGGPTCGALGYVADEACRCHREPGHEGDHEDTPGFGESVRWPKPPITGLLGPWGITPDTPEQIQARRGHWTDKEAIRRRNMQPPIPYCGWTTATLWDVTAVLAGHPELVGTDKACEPFPYLPPKVVLAKAKRLVRRTLIDGCTCGCRGDFAVIT